MYSSTIPEEQSDLSRLLTGVVFYNFYLLQLFGMYIVPFPLYPEMLPKGSPFGFIARTVRVCMSFICPDAQENFPVPPVILAVAIG